MMECALCPRSFVARPLDSQLQGSIVIGLACRDLVGCRQRQRNLLGRKHLDQTLAHHCIDDLRHH